MVPPFHNVHPFGLFKELEQRYLSYLKSTFVFRDAELRELFAQELEGGRLVNGPFVECTPVYERRTTTRSLLGELLGEEVEPAFLAALGANRLLYMHQERAMRRLAAGSNVVVATGTGSGKTEAFLLPILAALYRESLAGPRPPGVRALILYPMNALANDQRRRLGEIARTLREQGSAFSFTFGRYTGETPEDETDAGRKARQQLADRKAGELVLRSEMRQQPPDILLTNYSMLEYLLLRPDDSPLFDDGRGATWRFCVLDEAHQYRGTKGMEMAMLLRRLRQRLECGGLRRPLQYIATSASLGGGEQDRAELAKFAEQLFASPFTPEDIVLETLAHVPPGDVSLDAQTYRRISDVWHASPAEAKRGLSQVAAAYGLSPQAGLAPEEALYEILQHDVRVARLRDLLRQPRHVQAVADTLFPELDAPERLPALESFLNLVVRARQAASGSPLISLRYHLFLRALEGAYVRYHPGKRVSLVPLGEHTEGEGHTRSVAFELALCRECGQHYFVGRHEQGYLREAVRDAGDEQFSVSFFRPVEEAAADRGETWWRLCLECGAMRRPKGGLTPSSCGHRLVIDVVEEPASLASEDQMHTCGACSYRSQDPVRELIHGNDAPNAVIATAIHRCLPDDRKKVLGFADGRQDAAFFAWYLQDSYEKIVLRNLLFASARSLGDEGHREVSLPSLAARTSRLLRERGAAPESADELEIKRLAWLYLFRELLSDEQRTSLEGVGLVRWMPVLPEKLALPSALLQPPWSLSREEALLLMRWLLDSLRADGAVEVKAERGISLQWSDLGFVGKQVTVAIGGRGSEKAWDGPRTRRALFLQRVLAAGGASADPRKQTAAIQDLLREVWEAFRTCPGTDPILCHVCDAFRANPGWWRLRVLHEDDPLYCCDTCGRYQAFSIRSVCTRHACPGSLELVPAAASQRTLNHYRTLYVQDLPVRLRAEEHTAQIEPEQARRFQEEFERGHIHFLSCSTTFELGVDLGDLDTIFLRNVPPEPFNYAQRVGRAGRRPSHPGLAVTYCRRRPHDLTHFQDPTPLMEGRTRPPLLRISNAKIVWRHVLAFVLSHFFRSPGHAERFRSVATFLGEMEQPRALRDLAAFVEEHRSLLEAGLRSIVPGELHGPLQLDDGGWACRLTAADERLAVAISEASDDYTKVRQCEQEAAAAGNYGKAAWAQRRGKTIANEELISFLSRKAVIPKYGFPVDVVELDLQRAVSANNESTSVSLQRDLAIAVAEFAPGAKLVANKKVWTSYGLKRVAEREWDVRRYCKCRTHGTFKSWSLDDGPLPPRCCAQMRYGEYVDPLFGFITDGSPPAEPTHRPSRAYTTRPYFLGMDKAEADPIHAGPGVTVHKAAPGRLLVLCEGKKGRGFSICFKCGAGAEKASHQTPVGRKCDGRPKRVALGHEFITDVLRITFRDPPASAASSGREGFAYSLAYALLHGAHEILEVPLTDLNATVGSAAGAIHCEIVLYDNVPGGAGLVARLEDPAWLRRCMELARDRVQGMCGCDPSTSCFGCLRSYANQFIHPSLARGPVHQYLEQLLAGW